MMHDSLLNFRSVFFETPCIGYITQNYILCLPFEISRSLKTFKTSTNHYLVSNEYIYMVNPCCDVTKTTVNKIKNVSKMADISENIYISRTKQDMKNR